MRNDCLIVLSLECIKCFQTRQLNSAAHELSTIELYTIKFDFTLCEFHRNFLKYGFLGNCFFDKLISMSLRQSLEVKYTYQIITKIYMSSVDASVKHELVYPILQSWQLESNNNNVFSSNSWAFNILIFISELFQGIFIVFFSIELNKGNAWKN